MIQGEPSSSAPLERAEVPAPPSGGATKSFSNGFLAEYTQKYYFPTPHPHWRVHLAPRPERL